MQHKLYSPKDESEREVTRSSSRPATQQDLYNLECRLERALCQILRTLNEMEIKLMATIADLDAEIQGDLTDAATQIENALTAALAKITVPPDVQPQIDHIKAIAAALKAAAAQGAETVEVPPPPTP